MEFILLLASHYIADYWLQTEVDATNKHHSNKHLLSHTGMYTALLIPFALYYWWPNTEAIIQFLLITFAAHTVTDYFTSRAANKAHSTGQIRKFWRIHGVDQFLHTAQLYLCYILL